MATDNDIHTLGVDIGGTKVAAVVCDAAGLVLMRDRADTFVDGRRDPGLQISFNLAQQLMDRAAADGLNVTGIGVGVPEYVSPDGQLTSTEVMEWTVQPSQLFASLGNVVVESDVRCGAIAEAHSGAGRGLNTFLYVTVGTGLSSALVINGRVWAGRRGEAIALGELPLDGYAAETSMNLEMFSSGAGMADRYARATGNSSSSPVAVEAESGDSAALEITTSSARAIARALVGIARVLDPDAFVLGGGLGTSTGLWWQTLAEQYQESSRTRPNPPPLIQAALGNEAGAVGAALAARGVLRNNAQA